MSWVGVNDDQLSDVVVTSCLKRCVAEAISDVNTSSLSDEQRDELTLAMLSRIVQSSLAIQINCVDWDAKFQQLANYVRTFWTCAEDGIVQGCAPVSGVVVDDDLRVEASHDGQASYGLTASATVGTSRVYERRSAEAVSAENIAAALDEHVNSHFMTIQCCPMQWCTQELIPRCDSKTSVKEHIDEL